MSNDQWGLSYRAMQTQLEKEMNARNVLYAVNLARLGDFSGLDGLDGVPFVDALAQLTPEQVRAYEAVGVGGDEIEFSPWLTPPDNIRSGREIELAQQEFLSRSAVMRPVVDEKILAETLAELDFKIAMERQAAAEPEVELLGSVTAPAPYWPNMPSIAPKAEPVKKPDPTFVDKPREHDLRHLSARRDARWRAGASFDPMLGARGDEP